MKKFLINLISDIGNIRLFFLVNNKNTVCFFNENENTFQYLKHFIEKKRKKKIIFFSLKFINHNFDRNVHIIYLNYSFFIEVFFLLLKSKYIYSTTPGLNYTLFKKSIFSKNSKYIYIQHSPVSLIMAYHKKAFLEFDAIQTINKFQFKEVQNINKLHSKNIKPFKSKYVFLKDTNNPDKKFLLIAPTWKTDFYSSGFYLKLINELIKKNINFIFRPHYMSIKNKELNIDDLKFIEDKLDTSAKLNLSEYENLVSDWSGIYLEYLILNKKKPYLFNSNKKILNSEYNKDYNGTTIEEYAREKICFKYDFDELDFFIKDLNQNQDYNKSEINKFINENFYS